MQLGVEVAKNLILAGPKQVTIYDPRKVTIEETGRNFYCRSEHVGKATRAEASLDQLKDLNSSVNVSVTTDASIEFMYFIADLELLTTIAQWSSITTIATTSSNSTRPCTRKTQDSFTEAT